LSGKVPLTRLFLFLKEKSSLIGQVLEINLVQVNQQDNEQEEVDEKPHQKFAFPAFIFNML
jgi:hypothetical protein